MKTFIKKSLFFILPGLAFAGSDKAAFLKEKLIITPQEQAASKYNIIKKVIPSLTLSVFINWFVLKKFKQILLHCATVFQELPQNSHPNQQESIEDVKVFIRDFIHEKGIFLLIPGSLFFLIYYISHRIILNELEKAQFVKFVMEWQKNKHYTSHEFHKAFDELYASIEKNKGLDIKKANILKKRLNKFFLAK